MEISVKRRLLTVAGLLIAFGVMMRLLPHPANLAPVGAIAVFGGAVLPRKLAWWLPVAVMAISDAFIGFYPGIEWTWFSFLLVALYGMALRRQHTWARIPLGALGGSLIFFVVSNFGVWMSGGLYDHTLNGLLRCYLLALPFLRNTILGDMIYATLLFGVYALAERRINLAERATI